MPDLTAYLSLPVPEVVAGFLGQSPATVVVIFWLTVALAVVTVTLLLVVVSLRLHLLLHHRRNRRFRARWRPILYAWMEGQQSSLPRLPRKDHLAMLALWLDVRDYVAGDGALRLNELAAALKLDRIAADVLNKPSALPFQRSIWKRMLAIRVAQAVQTPIARQALIQASRSPSMMVAVAASAGLAQFDPAAAEPCILRTLVRFDRWAPFVALRISHAGGSRLLHLVGPHLHHLPQEKVRTLMSLAELSEDRSLLPLLRHRLKTTDDDREKAILLRAIGHLGSPLDRDVLQPLLNDENWILRVQAINAYARLGTETDIPALQPLLTDPQWWVRFRAAQAIWSLLGRDRRRLQQIQETARPEARVILGNILDEEMAQA